MTEAKDTVETTQTPAEEVKTETVETQEQPVKVEPNPLLKKIEVSVSKEELDKDIMARLKRYAKKAKFHGFRPGHAPMHMVAATYGAEAEQEAINDKAIAAAAKALDEGKFAVAGRPSIYPVEGQDQNAPEIKFAVEFEVYPDVTIPELKNVKVTEFECELSDEDVQKTLDVMLKQRTEYKKIDRVAQDGDLVDIDFEGKLNGEVFQGGKADHYKFILGEGRMLPAFEEAIRGMAAGEEKTFPLTFPEDYGAKELAGKEVSFTVKLNEVQEPIVPELNDEFAKSLGVADVAQLKADVKENLQRELKSRLTNKTKQNVMDALLKAAEFPVPETLVEIERQKMINDQKEMFKARGINVPDSIFENKEIMLEQAKGRVKLGLLLNEIVEKENIVAEPAQVKALAEDIAKSFEDPEEVVNWYLNDPERKAQLTGVVTENNVVDWVLKNAETVKETVKFEDLMSTQA